VSVERNRKQIERWVDIFNGGDMSKLEEIFATGGRTTRSDGRAGQGDLAGYRAAFPDLRKTVDVLVAEGDWVVLRWTNEGTHLGPWRDIAPTGKRVKWTGVNLYRFGDDGRVVENLPHIDWIDFYRQLGAEATRYR
jgi:predicted ester cyclase